MDFGTHGLQAVNVTKEEDKRKMETTTPFIYNLKPGDEDLLRPISYFSVIPGKNLRKKLIHAMNYWMDVPKDKLIAIFEIVDNLHNISLLIDDIEDDSPLRRGFPAAHTIFGIANVANACAFHQLGINDNVLQLNHPMAMRIYKDGCLTLFHGQGLELYWRDNVVCPTEEEYEQMVLGKTGGCFFLPYDFMQLFARKRVDLKRLLTALTVYFQINDDYLNLTNQTYFKIKGFCQDLTEGKFSYPIRHAVETNPKIGDEIMEILKERPTDMETKKRGLSLIESCGSIKHTKDRLDVLKATIEKELEKLEVNPLFNELLPVIMLKYYK